MFGIFKKKEHNMTAMDARKVSSRKQETENEKLARISASLIDSSISNLINTNKKNIERNCIAGRDECSLDQELPDGVITSDRKIIREKVKKYFIDLGYTIVREQWYGDKVSWAEPKTVTPLSRILNVKN